MEVAIISIGVLGGGLSGLTLAYLLDQQGMSFEIYEKDEVCGGLMRTFQEDGFTFDCGGSHIIFSRDQQVLDFMLGILGNNKVVKRRNAKILFKGCYVKYPFENDLAALPSTEKFECLYYFIQNLIEKEKGKLKKPTTLKEWCYYTFGKGIAENYLIPYNEKIWKYPSEKTSLDWVERIPNPPMEDIVKSSIGISTEGYTHQLNCYYHEVGGIQKITDYFENKLEQHINRQFEVKKLTKRGNNWVISDGEREREHKKIVSTIPVNRLVNALDAPKAVTNAAKDLKYNSLIVVMLGLNSSKVNDLTWLYIPDKSILAHRLSFPSNYSSFVTPHGKSSVLAEVTCTIGSNIWEMKDEEIINQVISDLHDLNIINKDKVCFAKAVRTEYAYVINDLNHKKNIRLILDFLKKNGIESVGRFAEFEYLNMDACIRHVFNFVAQKATFFD